MVRLVRLRRVAYRALWSRWGSVCTESSKIKVCLRRVEANKSRLSCSTPGQVARCWRDCLQPTMNPVPQPSAELVW